MDRSINPLIISGLPFSWTTAQVEQFLRANGVRGVIMVKLCYLSVTVDEDNIIRIPRGDGWILLNNQRNLTDCVILLQRPGLPIAGENTSIYVLAMDNLGWARSIIEREWRRLRFEEGLGGQQRVDYFRERRENREALDLQQQNDREIFLQQDPARQALLVRQALARVPGPAPPPRAVPLAPPPVVAAQAPPPVVAAAAPPPGAVALAPPPGAVALASMAPVAAPAPPPVVAAPAPPPKASAISSAIAGPSRKDGNSLQSTSAAGELPESRNGTQAPGVAGPSNQDISSSTSFAQAIGTSTVKNVAISCILLPGSAQDGAFSNDASPITSISRTKLDAKVVTFATFTETREISSDEEDGEDVDKEEEDDDEINVYGKLILSGNQYGASSILYFYDEDDEEEETDDDDETDVDNEKIEDQSSRDNNQTFDVSSMAGSLVAEDGAATDDDTASEHVTYNFGSGSSHEEIDDEDEDCPSDWEEGDCDLSNGCDNANQANESKVKSSIPNADVDEEEEWW